MGWGHGGTTAVLPVEKVVVCSWTKSDKENKKIIYWTLFAQYHTGAYVFKPYRLVTLCGLCRTFKFTIMIGFGVCFFFFKEGERVFLFLFFEGETKLAGLKEGVFTLFLANLFIRKKNLLFKPILKLEKGLLPKTSHLPTFSC